MFSFIKITKDKGDNIYDIRIPSSEKEEILRKYSLTFKYREKKYYIKEVTITINERGCFYNYEEDISIIVKDDYLIREFNISDCPYFSFFKCDVEEEYDLYTDNENSILLKDFGDYLTFELFKDKN